jgi:hypothetical protein
MAAPLHASSVGLTARRDDAPSPNIESNSTPLAPRLQLGIGLAAFVSP